MRILLVSHCFPPDNQAGVELYTANVADRLARAGHRVDVLTRRVSGGGAHCVVTREPLASGVEVHRLTRAPFAAHGSGLDDRELERAAVRVLDEIRPEVVHLTHAMHHAPRLIRRVLDSGVPVVGSLLDFFLICPLAHLRRTDGMSCGGPRGGRECAAHCFRDASRRDKRLWRRRARCFRDVLARADRLLCPSEFVRARFEAHVRDAARLLVAPIGINEVPAECRGTPARLDAGAALPALELAFVGALVEHKGCHVILDALGVARLPRVRLRLVGATPDAAYRARIERMAAGVEGLTLSVEGPFVAGTLHDRLRGVDAVVVPSLVEETFSLVAHEALAGGIAVLASRSGALPELVVDGVNGQLFDPARPGELAAQLVALSSSAERRRTLGRGAEATPVLRLETHVETLLRVYGEAIRSRSG